MAGARPRPPTRSQRPRRPARALPGLLCALAAAVAAHLCVLSRGFVPGPPQRAAPHVARRPVTIASGSRIPLAGRGGEGAGAGLQVGDKVQAVSPDDARRYPGTIEGANDDGTYVVRWDYPAEDGPETSDIAADNIKKIVIFRGYAVGDDVKAMSAEDGQWYPGSVVAVNGDGTFQVEWDKPDSGEKTADVKAEDMTKVNVFKDYNVGDAVDALYPQDGQMYPGTVVKANDDGTFQVKWDDADGGPQDSAVRPKNMRIPFSRLQIGQKHRGIVQRVFDWGAFVDIGTTGEGLLHISRLTEGRVDSIHDYVETAQEVEVWISDIRDDGKFGLAMVESKISGRGKISEGGGQKPKYDLAAFADVSPDDWLDGTVTSIVPFGIFVTVSSPGGEAMADGLVHISQVKEGFVESLEDEFQVGQTVKARVESINKERGRLGLTMKEPQSGGGGGAAGPEPVNLSVFEGIHPDQWLRGKVASLAPFGAFITVLAEDGTEAEGLLHITQISDDWVASVEDELEPGQEVEVRILNLDMELGRIFFTMREPYSDGGGPAPRGQPDLSAFEEIPSDQWLTGKVISTKPFGAFVTVVARDGTEADGLLHIAQIRDGFVESVEDELELGQVVRVRIVNVDAAAGKIGLSMKSPESDFQE